MGGNRARYIWATSGMMAAVLTLAGAAASRAAFQVLAPESGLT